LEESIRQYQRADCYYKKFIIYRIGQGSGKNPGTLNYFGGDNQVDGSALPKNTL